MLESRNWKIFNEISGLDAEGNGCVANDEDGKDTGRRVSIADLNNFSFCFRSCLAGQRLAVVVRACK